MSGIVWHILGFGAITIFLGVITYRMLAIARLPVHLRWELAPIPYERKRSQYGGSYLEEYEWWNKPQRRSRIAPILYMTKQVFLMRSIWQHNRGLWPLTYAFHMGIYLIMAMVFLSITNAALIITEVPLPVLNVSLRITSIVSLAGYLLGSLGVIGLIAKRTLDSNLRLFNTASKYFNLLILGAVFISGGYAWLHSGAFASEVSLFIKRLITLDSSVTVTFPLSLHIVMLLFFLMYLPFTGMIHFIAKYFTYHEIRWDAEPKDEKMEKELRSLLAQPVSWSAIHVKADGEKNWVDITTQDNE